MARKICDMFQFHQVKKTYYCVVRGWTETSEVINYPLRSESENELRIPAITSYERIAKVELPYPVGRYPTTRYSLLRVQPKSGRKHQIRRHLVHLSHPLIGDTVYGDGEHNRFFREHLSVSNLLLKAYTVEFPHPQTQEPVKISSRWNKTWHQIFDLFGQCPFEHTT
jgi:tRNA pseudouridine65 synthase